MSEIIPAILPKDSNDLVVKVAALPPEIAIFHFDVLETDIWSPVEKAFEVHLMVENPSAIVEKWVSRGAKRVVVHKFDVDIARFKGQVELGLGVELGMPLESIVPVISGVDFLHLMSIAEIGEQGHPFDDRIFARIKEAKAKFPNLPISIDGGISSGNYQTLSDMGVDRLIVGSHFNELWNSLTKK